MLRAATAGDPVEDRLAPFTEPLRLQLRCKLEVAGDHRVGAEDHPLAQSLPQLLVEVVAADFEQFVKFRAVFDARVWTTDALPFTRIGTPRWSQISLAKRPLQMSSQRS